MKLLKNTILLSLFMCLVLLAIIYEVDTKPTLSFIFSNETLKSILIGILSGAILSVAIAFVSYTYEKNKKIVNAIGVFRKIYHDIVVLNLLTRDVAEKVVKSVYMKIDADHINALSNDYYNSVKNIDSYVDDVDFLVNKSKIRSAFFDFYQYNMSLNNIKSLLTSFLQSYISVMLKKQQIEASLMTKTYKIELTQELQIVEIQAIARADAAIKSMQMVQNDLDVKMNNIFSLYDRKNPWPFIKQGIHQSAENIVNQRNA